MTSAQGRWTKQPDGADPRDLEGEELESSVDAGTLNPADSAQAAAAQADATQTDPAGYPHDPNPAVGLTPTEQRLRDLAEEDEADRENEPEAPG